MTRQYFGTDGIRGTVGQPPITPDFVLRLAMPWAACSSAAKSAPRC
jgi:phosphoglucosamine mutase